MIDKKAMLAKIMSGMDKKPKRPEYSVEVESEDDEDDVDADLGLESAAEDIMSALDRGDAKKLAMALKSFMDLC
jgi:hypothetical protein